MQFDRPLFRTTRSLTINLVICLSFMFLLVALGSYRTNRSPWESFAVYVYIFCLPLPLTLKALRMLWDAEKRGLPLTPELNALSSYALLLPALAGLIPVGLMMQIAR
jgi:hypothetical protein